MNKHRTSYSLNGMHFEIEQYKGKYKKVPCFLEIEAPNIKLIHKYAQILGFTKEQCLPWSTWDVVRHYKLKE